MNRIQSLTNHLAEPEGMKNNHANEKIHDSASRSNEASSRTVLDPVATSPTEASVDSRLAPKHQLGELRDYSKETREASRVRNHYRDMRLYQTPDFVRRMEATWKPLDKARMTIREAFDVLANYVDASDPDLDLPNIVHAFQCAEAARCAGEPDWLQLTLLLHDLGKIMFAWGTDEDGMSGRADGKQFCLGGDTWVMDHEIPSSVVFPEFNELNPCHKIAPSQSPYAPHCGIRNIRFAFGHDEYGYYILSDPRNGCMLPPLALQMVCLHSCYPLHRDRAYDHLLADGDEEILKAVTLLNKYDLYSKADHTVGDLEKFWPYYLSLVDKYFVEGRNQRLFF